MKQCPNCQAEVKADERFCGSCGARLEPSTPPETNQPPQKTGRETVVLSLPSDFGATPPPPQPQPSMDATLIAGPAAQPQSPTDATLIGMQPGAQPAQPNSYPSGGGTYTGASLPPSVMPPAAQSGGNIWKILAIIAGIGVVACALLAGGVYFFIIKPVGRAVNTSLGTAQAGLPVGLAATISAGMETAVADGLDATDVPNGELDATDVPEATPLDDTKAVLYSDNFDDPGKSGFASSETDSASYKLVDGAFSVTVKKPKLIVWKTIKGDYGDASISVDATLKGKKASSVGLIFHYTDDKNVYLYTVDEAGRYELDVYKDDDLTTLVDPTDSPAIKPIGQMNTLRVETVGDTIRLYANDTLLDELSDSTISKGKSAVVVNTFDDPNITAIFDNLVIQSVK